jgi:hypothetical protein
VPEDERVALDGDDPADDVHDVADAKLADVAYVTIGGDTETAASSGVARAEPERIEHAERGVAEPGEVERDGQVVVVVDLPAIDDPTICFEPAVHDGLLLNSIAQPARSE